jgi:hypothetical protein
MASTMMRHRTSQQLLRERIPAVLIPMTSTPGTGGAFLEARTT